MIDHQSEVTKTRQIRLPTPLPPTPGQQWPIAIRRPNTIKNFRPLAANRRIFTAITHTPFRFCVMRQLEWLSHYGSKWTTTGREIKAKFTASNACLWSSVHTYGFRVLRRGRSFAAATSDENPASCSTRPMNDVNSEMLVGRGNCDRALNLASPIVSPPCRIS